MTLSLEVRIPIGPTRSMFLRAQLIAYAMRTLGPLYIDTRTQVFIGSPKEPFEQIANALIDKAHLDILWRWIDPGKFMRWAQTANPHIATMTERFRPPFTSEWVLFLDADVLPIAPFDELFQHCNTDSVFAMMAHASPFQHHIQQWNAIYAQALNGRFPVFQHEHSGWGIMDNNPSRRFSPPYFNTGVVLARSSFLNHFWSVLEEMTEFVGKNMNSYFTDQIAFTLALEKMQVALHFLPLRFNFPNQIEFDRHWPNELAQAKFIHFLRPDKINRETEFASLGAMKELVRRSDLVGSNEVLRNKVAELLPGFEEALT